MDGGYDMMQNTIYAIAASGCALAIVNAILWFGQWMSERSWKFIGASTLRWCLLRMWLNLGMALVFAAAAWWAERPN